MSTCATASRHLQEPLAATAAVARTWLLLEQPGPWGAKAVTDSHLYPEVGRELERRAKDTGVRIALIRRPGRHADSHTPQRHRVIVAHTVPGSGWVRHTVVDDPAELLALDLPTLGRGEHGGLGEPYSGVPVALVCTNGKRDRCCALLGRPLAADLVAMGGVEVWEITHMGGHRFAPTMLVLPFGYAYGRLSANDAKEVLEATGQGRMAARWCRGRSAWDRPGQAAELAVRELTGEDRAEALTVHEIADDGTGGWAVRVTHADGRAWTVGARQEEQEPARPESCGAAPGHPLRVAASSITAITAGPPRT